MASISSETTDPFDALDADWSVLCRQHRRSGVVRRWATQEAVLDGIDRLGDVIPPLKVDRGAICAALARLQQEGDGLAGRALLQLCVPGLMYLAAKWRPRMQGTNAAGWEVVTRAGIYIARLREGEIHCRVGVAGSLLRSVHRDLVREARQQVRHNSELANQWYDDEDDPHRDRGQGLAPSAEDIVCADHVVRAALEAATWSGFVPIDAARTVWLLLSGQPMVEASRLADRSIAAIYRHRDRTYAHIYEQLFTDTYTGRGGRRLSVAGV